MTTGPLKLRREMVSGIVLVCKSLTDKRMKTATDTSRYYMMLVTLQSCDLKTKVDVHFEK